MASRELKPEQDPKPGCKVLLPSAPGAIDAKSSGVLHAACCMQLKTVSDLRRQAMDIPVRNESRLRG